MEYYLFADSPDILSELSTESLAHLYIMKVQGNLKPFKTIRKRARKKLVEALMKAVCQLPEFWSQS